MNRPGISGGSNSQVDWSRYEQDDEQIQPRGPCPRGADVIGSRERTYLPLGGGDVVLYWALSMQLRYADAIDNAQYRTTSPPQLVLSEGQMAANGFSILCVASTAYRWSRWRALLLDGPLQHNDIIHAAAFVDVMRNLVEFEGYKLIMSSHKRDEGEFVDFH